MSRWSIRTPRLDGIGEYGPQWHTNLKCNGGAEVLKSWPRLWYYSVCRVQK